MKKNECLVIALAQLACIAVFVVFALSCQSSSESAYEQAFLKASMMNGSNTGSVDASDPSKP